MIRRPPNDKRYLNAKIAIEGLGFARQLGLFTRVETDKWKRESVTHFAEQTAETAKQLVPVDTGALRKSIRVEEKEDGTSEVLAGPGADGREYAAPIEFGWRPPGSNLKQRSQPYLRPAVVSTNNKDLPFFFQAFNRRWRRYFRRGVVR